MVTKKIKSVAATLASKILKRTKNENLAEINRKLGRDYIFELATKHGHEPFTWIQHLNCEYRVMAFENIANQMSTADNAVATKFTEETIRKFEKEFLLKNKKKKGV